MAMIPLLVGLGGTKTLQDVESFLNLNSRSMQVLAGLMSSAETSLQESMQLQKNAKNVSQEVAGSQSQANKALLDIENIILPQTLAIDQMRYALANASTAELGILLALNMRHLGPEELLATLTLQRTNMGEALSLLDSARERYISLNQSSNTDQVWRDFETSLEDLKGNHGDFMNEVAKLEDLVDELIRGGPLFASASRSAYDTIFISGKDARDNCEQKIALLSQSVMNQVNHDVNQVTAMQNRSIASIENLNNDIAFSTSKAEEMRTRFYSAILTAESASSEANHTIDETSERYWLMIIISGLGITSGITIGLILAFRISNPIRQMAGQMSKLAQGDLANDVKNAYCVRKDEIGQLALAMQDMIKTNRDEITMANAIADGDYTHTVVPRSDLDQLGKALRTMLSNANDTMRQVGQAIVRIGDGASVVSKASHSLQQGAQTSAAALEEIALTAKNVDGNARTNALRAKEANSLATASSDAAKRGYKAVTELVTAMREIQESGHQIASVAKLIDDIAFQTNLLALNAAVEAARAGRYGRGFAVVAEEVRNLSGRSAKAARETGAMVEAMSAKMETGTHLAARTDQEFKEIVASTVKVASLFVEIDEASNSQSAAMGQVSNGLGQIDTVIQENLRSAEQTSMSSHSLLEQAEELRRMIDRFKLNERDFSGSQSESAKFLGQFPARPPRELPTRRSATQLLDLKSHRPSSNLPNSYKQPAAPTLPNSYKQPAERGEYRGQGI
ncbi:MAG: methyl-accepting chemotaxis protein [Planctomycetota bacterium]|nr:methyl-accepting chemotaxis protein [Planctomycetota bacterium]